MTSISWATSLLCFFRLLWLQVYWNLQYSSNKIIPQFFLKFLLSNLRECQIKFFPLYFAKNLAYLRRHVFSKKMRQIFVAISLLYRAIQKYDKNSWGLSAYKMDQNICALFCELVEWTYIDIEWIYRYY